MWETAARQIPRWVLVDIIRALPPSPTSLNHSPVTWLMELDWRQGGVR